MSGCFQPTQRNRDCDTKWKGCIRVFIDKRGDIVDFVMDHHVKVLLGVVSRNLGVGECLLGHGGYGIGKWKLGKGRWEKTKSPTEEITVKENHVSKLSYCKMCPWAPDVLNRTLIQFCWVFFFFKLEEVESYPNCIQEWTDNHRHCCVR